MNVEILPSAMDDLTKGYVFYNSQEFGLGEYFLDTLFSDIDSLRLYSGIHARCFGYYRLLSKRFPYAIYYTVSETTSLVWRVLDLRMHPDKIHNALGS